MKNTGKVLIFIALLSSFFACRLEPDAAPSPAPWKLEVADADIWNVQAVADKLFVQTSTTLYTLDAGSTQSPCLTFDTIGFRIPISKTIAVKPSADGQYLDFYATKNLCGGTPKHIKVSDFSIPSLETLNPVNWSHMLATDDAHFLCAFAINSYRYQLALFSVQFTDASQTEVSAVTAQKIEVPDVSQFFDIQMFNGKIFAGYRSVADEFNTITVNTDGSWQSVFPDLSRQIVSLGNTSYAFGTKNIYKSSDAGNSWTYYSDLYNKDGWPAYPVDLRFATVYNKLIGFQKFDGPHLYVIEETVDSNFEKYWELDHSGINDISIYTDMFVPFGEKIYLRTAEGVLSRPAAEFFTPE